MKLTKARIKKLFNGNNQTRKKLKTSKKINTHTHTNRKWKQFNLRNNTLKRF
jgi:hypothetical protein